jgi:WD40 repeat protein
LIIHDENTVNELAFNPFNDSLLATACNDGAAFLWQIPDGGLTSNLTKPLSKIQVSDKRLLLLDFHPLAENIMVVGDASKTIKIFDIESSKEELIFPEHKGLVTNVSWNYDGSQCATSCKDKTLRVIDPRSNKVVAEAQDHQGAKGGRVVWLGKKDLIFTVGFGKGSERQFALYDPRKNLQRITLQPIDNSASTLLPFYDNDLGLLYLAGKGDGNIRYYEIVENEDPYIFYLNEFKSKDPQSGLAFLPKQSCDVMKCEVAKVLKLTPSGSVVPIRFEVPRKENVFFQEDIFPDTFDLKPSMSNTDWLGGAKNPPNLVSLNPEKK